MPPLQVMNPVSSTTPQVARQIAEFAVRPKFLLQHMLLLPFIFLLVYLVNGDHRIGVYASMLSIDLRLI